MTLSIPTEYEAIIHEAVASGAFASPEEAVKHALSLLAEEHEERKVNNPESPRLSEKERQKRLKSFEKWLASKGERIRRARKFREWAGRQLPGGHCVDDSRESIY